MIHLALNFLGEKCDSCHDEIGRWTLTIGSSGTMHVCEGCLSDLEGMIRTRIGLWSGATK